MKKFLSVITVLLAISFSKEVRSQENTQSFRFGLRLSPQPTWFSSDDKNLTMDGTKLGFGFGLNMEFRINNVSALLTGIGGDFEGGKYKFRNDPDYQAVYWLDESLELVKPKVEDKGKGTAYFLSSRTVRNTFVTVPLILKLSTKEINGLKYFGMFGTEIGVRVKALANDTYFASGKYVNDTLRVTAIPSGQTEENIDISKESSLIPIRAGLNVGLGAEYRLAGSTSFFFNVNYFRSFTNLLRKESDHIYIRNNATAFEDGYKFIKQSLIYNAIRVNIGIMF
jgi:hypothetical protein